VTLRQVSPGRYEGRVIADASKIVTVTSTAPGASAQVVVPDPSAEYRFRPTDEALLKSIAAATGVENSSDLPRIVGATRPGNQVPVEVWRKGAARNLTVTVGELQEDRVAVLNPPRGQRQTEQAANRLGIVVSELTAEQKKDHKLSHGVVVTDVKPNARAEVRRGDVLLTMVHKGQHTELKTAEQFNKLLNALDHNAVLTLQVRRGDNTAFVTVTGLGDKG